MKQFEYLIKEMSTMYTEDVNKILNKLGKERWELVNVIHCSSSDSSYAQYIFKREIIKNEGIL